jgi:hypothetical protein
MHTRADPLALTIRLPWAARIVWGDHAEHRGWRSFYRGLLYIHSAVRIDGEAPADAWDLPAAPAGWENLRGVIIGSARLVDCVPADGGGWHWVLDERAALPEPVPARGIPALWPAEQALTAHVARKSC